MHLGLEGIVPTTLWVGMFVCFLLSVFWRPSTGLFLLIPMLPLETIRYRLHGFFLGPQFIDILLLGVIIGLKRQGRPIFPKTPLNGILLVYIILTYLSLARGSLFLGVDLPYSIGDPRFSTWKNFVFDLTLIFFVTVSAIRTRREMGILFFMMSIGVLLVAKGFHNIVGERDFSQFSYDLRDAGPLGGAGVNGLAAFGAQATIFFLGMWISERRLWAKAAYTGVMAAGGYCVLYALSRGAYAALLVGVVFVGMAKSRVLLVGLVLFLIGWQAVVPHAVVQRVLMTTDSKGEVESSAAARMNLWEEAMQVFQADPLFGTGFNTYWYSAHVGGFGDTHNVYVKVLVETGLVGLCVFVTIFRRLFRIGRRLWQSAADPFLKSIGLGFSALMIAVFVGNLFGDRWLYFSITGYTYAFAALAVRAQMMTDEANLEMQTGEMQAAEMQAAEMQEAGIVAAGA